MVVFEFELLSTIVVALFKDVCIVLLVETPLILFVELKGIKVPPEGIRG
jgi:hypothetical protein